MQTAPEQERTDLHLCEAEALHALLSHLTNVRYSFTTPTPATHSLNLRQWGGREAADYRDALGWNLPFRRDLFPPRLLEALESANFCHCDKVELWHSHIRVSSCDGRLFAHSGYPTVAPDAVFFGPDTYRFVRAIVAHLNRSEEIHRAVDIGCGTGAGAAAIADHSRAHEIFALDVNDSALAFAAVNLSSACLPKIVIKKSNLLNQVEGEFDLIVANPPYLNDPLGRTYRHGGGKFGGGLSVAIARLGLTRLRRGGRLILYTGSAIVRGRDLFLEEIDVALHNSNCKFTYEEIDPDVFGEELETENYHEAERIAAVLAVITREN